MNEFAARARNVESTVPRQKVDAPPTSEDSNFRDLVETSLQGIIVNRDWRILFASWSAAQTLGYASVAELLSVESMLRLCRGRPTSRRLSATANGKCCNCLPKAAPPPTSRPSCTSA